MQTVLLDALRGCADPGSVQRPCLAKHGGDGRMGCNRRVLPPHTDRTGKSPRLARHSPSHSSRNAQSPNIREHHQHRGLGRSIWHMLGGEILVNDKQEVNGTAQGSDYCSSLLVTGPVCFCRFVISQPNRIPKFPADLTGVVVYSVCHPSLHCVVGSCGGI